MVVCERVPELLDIFEEHSFYSWDLAHSKIARMGAEMSISNDTAGLVFTLTKNNHCIFKGNLKKLKKYLEI